jgi:hypothetical protein
MKRSKGRKMNIDRQAKSCGKAAPWKPLETGVPTALGNPATDAGFPLSHSCNNNKLDDRDHYQQNAKTSVASLRGLIGSSRNIDRHRNGMLIDFIGIPSCESCLCSHQKVTRASQLSQVKCFVHFVHSSKQTTIRLGMGRARSLGRRA